MALDGTVNTASSVAYIEQVLGSTLAPGDVVVLDKLAHIQSARPQPRWAPKAAWPRPSPLSGPAACSCRLTRLTLRPLNGPSASLKLVYARPKARTRDALALALRMALDWISETDAKHWFDQCGYHVH